MKRLLVLNLIMLATVYGCSPNDNAAADNAAADNAVTVNAVGQAVAEEKPAVSTGNSTATSAKVTQVAAQCSACHNNMVDLSEVPTDELVAAISDIIATKKPHPTAVPELTEAQMQELAALLRKP
jgi:cytochrome c553